MRQVSSESRFLKKQPTSDGKARLHIYEHGAIYWLVVSPSGSGPSTETYEVHGAIWEHYQQLGREDIFGLPLSDETAASDGVGRFNLFMDGGGISTGRPVHTRCTARFTRSGGRSEVSAAPSVTRLPMRARALRKRCFNHFQAGSIYWTPETDAHEVHGAIHEKWSELGWERSFLGYPTSDEEPDSYNAGTRVSHFQGGVIYWSGQTRAHEMHGAILAKWQELGRAQLPRSSLTDEEIWLSEKINRGSEPLPARRDRLDARDGCRALAEQLLVHGHRHEDHEHPLQARRH